MTKVLIVEDEAPIANAYKIVLEQAGCEVLVANEAESGLHLAKSEKPDVILLDIMLPNVNGLDMLKNLDIKKSLPHTRVIALSNVESQEVVDEALSLGAADFLRKVDFTPHQIVDIVKKYAPK